LLLEDIAYFKGENNMFKKLKNEINRIKWPDKWLLAEDLKVVCIGVIGLILAISIIDWLSKLTLGLIF